jgi:hypothetical protein
VVSEKAVVAAFIAACVCGILWAVNGLVEANAPPPNGNCPIVGHVELPWARGSWTTHLTCRQCEGEPWVCR